MRKFIIFALFFINSWQQYFAQNLISKEKSNFRRLRNEHTSNESSDHKDKVSAKPHDNGFIETTHKEISALTGTSTTVFTFSGSIVTYTVPTGGFSLTIIAKGAQGGSASGGQGGNGAQMRGTFNVTAGQVLSILVGGQGGNSNYPAGGGGTFVALGSYYPLSTPLIIAGGGGGALYTGYSGQGGLTTQLGGGPVSGTAGYGAPSTLCGGGGGGFYTAGGDDTSYPLYGGGGSSFLDGGAG